MKEENEEGEVEKLKYFYHHEVLELKKNLERAKFLSESEDIKEEL